MLYICLHCWGLHLLIFWCPCYPWILCKGPTWPRKKLNFNFCSYFLILTQKILIILVNIFDTSSGFNIGFQHAVPQGPPKFLEFVFIRLLTYFACCWEDSFGVKSILKSSWGLDHILYKMFMSSDDPCVYWFRATGGFIGSCGRLSNQKLNQYEFWHLFQFGIHFCTDQWVNLDYRRPDEWEITVYSCDCCFSWYMYKICLQHFNVYISWRSQIIRWLLCVSLYIYYVSSCHFILCDRLS